jgi:membrane protease YdiL (CAAX protease family)
LDNFNEISSSSKETLPPSSPSTLHRIFIGDEGLRAGWGLLLFLFLFVVPLLVVLHQLHLKNNRNEPVSPTFMLSLEGLQFAWAVVITWIMSKIEGRPIGVYGLGGHRKAARFFAGLGWGVLFLSLLVLILSKTGVLLIDRRLLFGSDILRYGAIWLVGFLFVALLEEYLVRGYIQYTLTRGVAAIYRLVFKTSHSHDLGFWTAALILSFIFGFGHGHNPGESPIGLLSAGSIALVFCLTLWRTGSLWWAVGLHAAWDWSQSFLYGVADSGTFVKFHLLASHPVGKPLLSGGTTGPEGSVYVLLIELLIVLVILATLPARKPEVEPSI